MIATRRLDNPRKLGPLWLEQLCRTKNGAWFSLYLETINGSGFARGLDLKPLSELDAAVWLERDDHELYCRLFGEPKLA